MNNRPFPPYLKDHFTRVLKSPDYEIQLAVNKGFCWVSQRHLGLRAVTYPQRKKIQEIFSLIYTLLKTYFANILKPYCL